MSAIPMGYGLAVGAGALSIHWVLDGLGLDLGFGLGLDDLGLGLDGPNSLGLDGQRPQGSAVRAGALHVEPSPSTG